MKPWLTRLAVIAALVTIVWQAATIQRLHLEADTLTRQVSALESDVYWARKSTRIWYDAYQDAWWFVDTAKWHERHDAELWRSALDNAERNKRAQAHREGRL